MIGLYFIYGLAFFSLGLAILLYPKKDSQIAFAQDIWLVALFGLLHGIHEWIDMFVLIQGSSDAVYYYLRTARFSLLPASFFFLVWYGSETLTEQFNLSRPIKYLPLVLLTLWIGCTLFSRERFLMGDIWARYLLCVPGSLLTAYALSRHRKTFNRLGLHGPSVYMTVATGTFLVYGLLAGLIVPHAEVSPAFLLNDAAFLDLVGLPVQWFRAICAVVLSYTLVRVLRIFEWETGNARKRTLAELDRLVEERTHDLRTTNERLEREVLHRREAEKQLEAAIHQSQEEKAKAEGVIEAIGDGISIQDKDFKILYQNETHRKMFGNCVGEICYVAFHDREHVCDNCPVAACFTDSKVHRSQRSVNTATGAVHYEVTASPLRNREGKIFACIELVQDATERRRLEDELVKAEKLESLGVLAGGIAHDFNNLLTGILANLDLAKAQIDPGSPPHKRLLEAEKASLRAKDLVNQLSTFAKGNAPIRKAISIGDILRESAPFVLSGSNVRCAFDIAEDLRWVHADHGQISQVVQNLVLNAAQSMPKGGTIVARARNASLQPEDGLPLVPGNYVQITIQDEGTGIANEYLDKIFDPYFSTKDEGSGLGLTVAYSIVIKHDGFITADSDRTGTAFHIYLPASERSARSTPDLEAPDLIGQGKILVMDDEEYVRRVAKEILARFGYDVVSARDGTEAVAHFAEASAAGSPFDAVIVDLTIPGGIGGAETLERLREIDPKVKGIVASGYSNNPILANYRDFGFKGALAKPFNVQELGEAVQRVLRKTG